MYKQKILEFKMEKIADMGFEREERYTDRYFEQY